jgi:hypothetical protein
MQRRRRERLSLYFALCRRFVLCRNDAALSRRTGCRAQCRKLGRVHRCAAAGHAHLSPGIRPNYRRNRRRASGEGMAPCEEGSADQRRVQSAAGACKAQRAFCVVRAQPRMSIAARRSWVLRDASFVKLRTLLRMRWISHGLSKGPKKFFLILRSRRRRRLEGPTIVMQWKSRERSNAYFIVSPITATD